MLCACMCTEFIWLVITYKWRALVSTVMNIGFRKTRGIFTLAKELLAFYKGLPHGVLVCYWSSV